MQLQRRLLEGYHRVPNPPGDPTQEYKNKREKQEALKCPVRNEVGFRKFCAEHPDDDPVYLAQLFRFGSEYRPQQYPTNTYHLAYIHKDNLIPEEKALVRKEFEEIGATVYDE